jgi:hypothetical protein
MDLLDNMAFIIDTALAPTILFFPCKYILCSCARSDSAGFSFKPVASTAAATSSTTTATSQIQLPDPTWPPLARDCHQLLS